MNQKVTIPAFFVRPGKIGGAEYMFYTLLRGLASALPEGTATVLEYEDSPLPQQTPGMRHLGLKAPRNRFMAEAGAAATRRQDCTISPNYFTPPVAQGRRVTIIHDAQFRHLPQNFSRRKRMWLSANHAHTMRFADKVVAISEFVKQDLIDHHGAKQDQVVVIHNPIDWSRFEQGAEPQHVGVHNYFLTVSAHYPHKNLATLLRAFRAYRERGGTRELVLAGTPADQLVGTTGANPLEFLLKEPEYLDGVHILGHISDRQIGELYRGASALFFPSLFEGFGMPAVEALGFGIPVVCSRIPPLVEATLDLGNYCGEPTSIGAWAEWMSAAEARQLRRPTDDEVGIIRETYAPTRIGRAYAELCLG